jgi:MFS family permease
VSIFANLTFDFYALLDGFLFFWVFLYKLQYSVFGSIVTIGGMVGAILSGKMADLIGRRGVISLTTLLALKI